MKWFWSLPLVTILLSGCAGGPDGIDTGGWVLLDADARSAGVVLEAEPAESAARPLAIDTASPVRYRVGARRGLLDVDAESLVVVHGVDAATESFRVGA